jgi:hypothetical protein
MCKTIIRLALLAPLFLFSLPIIACAPSAHTDGVGDIEDESSAETVFKTISAEPCSEYRGVKIVIVSVSPQGATIRIENEHGYDVMLGLGFTVFALNGGEVGERVQTNNEIAVPALLAFLSANPDLQERYIDFDFYFGGLKPGRYRFLIPDMCISDDAEMPGKGKVYEVVSLYADFVIG